MAWCIAGVKVCLGARKKNLKEFLINIVEMRMIQFLGSGMVFRRFNGLTWCKKKTCLMELSYLHLEHGGYEVYASPWK